jgi:hypothetical protein
MKMGHDEIGIRNLPVKRGNGEHDARQAAIRNWNKKPTQNSRGVSNRSFPPYIVPSQLKILIPVGTPTTIDETAQ